MTDSEKGLPIRGYEWRYVDWEEAHTTLRKDKPDRTSFDVDIEIERRLTGIDDVKALIENEGRTLYECNMCGYISSDVQEVADCCYADAIYYDFIRKIDLVQKVECEASE